MPFVVRYPGAIGAGSTDDHIILNTDFAATLLDFGGVEQHHSMQSESFRPILEGQEPSNWREIMYYRYYRSHFNTPSHWGVRTKRHKLIYYNLSNEYELFDLEKDPMEMRSVYGEMAYAETAEHLEDELKRLQSELKDTENGFEGEIRALNLLKGKPHPLYRL